jgi:hypothetical protein
MLINASGKLAEALIFTGVDSPAPAGSIPATSTKLSRSSNLFHSLGPELGLGGVVGEESLGLL